jgi:hypothetical protein
MGSRKFVYSLSTIFVSEHSRHKIHEQATTLQKKIMNFILMNFVTLEKTIENKYSGLNIFPPYCLVTCTIIC